MRYSIMNELITVKQLAEQRGVTPQTVRRWIEKGQIPRPLIQIGCALHWHRRTLNKQLQVMGYKAAIELARAELEAQQ